MNHYAELLIVDDMPDHIAYSGALLRAAGYHVFAASSGRAAEVFLQRHIPDLILLDIQMDDIDGLTLCKHIKENPETAHVPVVFLTSETSPDTIAQSFELGGCDYVKKPFVKQEFLSRIQTHLKVSAQQRELSNANEELRNFCSAVSHDLKAPFNIINMLITMLADELGEPEQNVAEIMDMIQAKSTQTRIMIERLFEFSKMCNISPKMSALDLKPIAEETFAELKQLHPDRNINFSCGVLPIVNCDEVLMRMILKNLIGNAIKYTGKVENAVISITGDTDEHFHHITIRDNGAGFDMKYASKLFQVFQRLHSEEEFEGSGVGLALSNRIMYRHGGKITAFGEVGKGASFTLSFPIRNAATATPSA